MDLILRRVIISEIGKVFGIPLQKFVMITVNYRLGSRNKEKLQTWADSYVQAVCRKQYAKKQQWLKQGHSLIIFIPTK